MLNDRVLLCPVSQKYDPEITSMFLTHYCLASLFMNESGTADVIKIYFHFHTDWKLTIYIWLNVKWTAHTARRILS